MDERRTEIRLDDSFIYVTNNTERVVVASGDMEHAYIEPVEVVNMDSSVDALSTVVDYCQPNVATRECACCGGSFPFSHLYGCVDGNEICSECYNSQSRFVRCDRCELIVNTDTDDYEDSHDLLCAECYRHVAQGTYGEVLGYHRFNDWRFNFAKDETPHSLVTGIELEVEHVNSCRESTNEIVWELNKMLGFNTICSRDGSIDNGFEIVSQPFSLAFIREHEETIKEALKYLIDHGYRGDQVSTCGLHLHINREAFGETSKEQNKNIDKLILFFETYKQELFRFSRRSANKLQRWAKFLSDYKNINVDSDTDRAKQLKSLDYIGKTKTSIEERYCAVNLLNNNTVEIRIFKSSLNYKTVFATIELIHTLVRRIMNYENIEDFNWNNVVNDEDCRYLKEYCEIRGISTDKPLVDYSECYKETMAEKNKMTMQNLIKRTESLLHRMMKYYSRKSLEYQRSQNATLDSLVLWLQQLNESHEEVENLKDNYNIYKNYIEALWTFQWNGMSARRIMLTTYWKEINTLKAMIERIDEECV